MGGGRREFDFGVLVFVAGRFVEADGDGEDGGGAGGDGESAFDLVEVVAGIDGEAFGLGDGDALGLPRGVGEFEDGANGAVGDDFSGRVVLADGEFLAVPDAGAAAAAGGADLIHVHAFAFVFVIVVVALVIPAVDDGVAHAFAPDIEAGGGLLW